LFYQQASRSLFYSRLFSHGKKEVNVDKSQSNTFNWTLNSRGMFIYTFLLVKASLLFHKMQFSFACFLITLRQHISSKIFSLVPGNIWLECSLIALINYIMRGIKKLTYIVRFFFCLEKTCGHCWWRNLAGSHNTSTGSALTFVFSFLYAYSEPLSLSVLWHSLTLGKLRCGSACHRQTCMLIPISNRKIQSEDFYWFVGQLTLHLQSMY